MNSLSNSKSSGTGFPSPLTASPCARPESEVESQLSVLQSRLHDTGLVIARLRERLSPVLRFTPPESGSGKVTCAPLPQLVPLAHTLRQANDEAQGHLVELTEIVSGLEC